MVAPTANTHTHTLSHKHTHTLSLKHTHTHTHRADDGHLGQALLERGLDEGAVGRRVLAVLVVVDAHDPAWGRGGWRVRPSTRVALVGWGWVSE
mgnify:CR=1 FL=1